MKGFFLAVALVLVSVFIAVPSFAHGGDHQNTTLASDVMNGVDNDENRDALKNFVAHARDHIREAEHIEDLIVLLAEFEREEGDWIAHEGSIYLYIFADVSSDAEGEEEHEEIVIFNANNPRVVGLNLHEMTDANGLEIAHELIEAVDGDGFAEYTWDDPRIEGDEVSEAGKSPGTSPKIGYVEKVTLLDDPQTFLIGSGFYPAPLMDDSDDDGCAIAGGTATGRDSLGLLFNLFLVVSALFLAVSWRIHTVRR